MTIKRTAKGIYRTIRNYVFPFRQSDGKASGSIYEYKFIDDTGATIDLSMYKGKKLLIVNTASACGFTGQYSEMQQLSEKFKDKVNVIAFHVMISGNRKKERMKIFRVSAQLITVLHLKYFAKQILSEQQRLTYFTG
jgi:hypothetical protein